MLKPDDLVMGTSELGFSLGFDESPVSRRCLVRLLVGAESDRAGGGPLVLRPVIETATSRGMPSAAYYDELFRSFSLVREMKGYRIYRR